jgi:periplasmic divalent cation tolerance protein
VKLPSQKRLKESINMSATALCSVYVTTPDLESAKKIADHILSQRLAACANIFPGVSSIYWWQGNLERDNEVAILFKTRASLFESLCKAVKENHPYTVPCIVQWPIVDVHPPYGAWVVAETENSLSR